jgi:hypothetical protein
MLCQKKSKMHRGKTQNQKKRVLSFISQSVVFSCGKKVSISSFSVALGNQKKLI